MSLQKSDLMIKELSEYLDELPVTPCEDPPTSRYFCTVCERLNKSVQSQCRIYKSRSEQVGLVKKEDYDDYPDLEEKTDTKQEDADKVEFKVVTENDMDARGMPMFEIVKPPVEDTEPLEMSLLEKEAVEFELMGDEKISEDAIEVEPMEVNELEDDFEGLEVEPLEVDEFEELPEDSGVAPETAIKAAPQPASPVSAKPKKAVKKRKPKVKAAATPAAVQPGVASVHSPKPAAVSIPKPASVSTPKPAVSAVPKPSPSPAQVPAATTPSSKPIPTEDIPPDLLKEIEEQLIATSNCNLCGAGLTNTNFCTQCGAKVVITVDGVHTVSREEQPSAEVPKRKVKRKVVRK